MPLRGADTSSSKYWDTYFPLLRTCVHIHMPPSCTTAADSLVGFSHPVSPYKITLSQEQFSKQQVLPRSQQSSPPHSWCKQPSVYCLSTSSMGHCLPPPCSSQSISTAVFPKDYISGGGWGVVGGEGHFAGPAASQPWTAETVYPSVLHKSITPPLEDAPGKLAWQTVVKDRPSLVSLGLGS